jgi:hypothetical protein
MSADPEQYTLLLQIRMLSKCNSSSSRALALACLQIFTPESLSTLLNAGVGVRLGLSGFIQR